MATPGPKRRVTVKIVVLGDSNVGKTCLLQRYVNNTWSANYKTTIGANFLAKELIVEGLNVALHIWDTAGQEKYHAITSNYYRGCDACVLVYDITDRDSFEHIEKWRQDLLSYTQPSSPESFPFVLLGSKLDLAEERVVTRQEAEVLAQSLAIPYFEVSSKENVNVDAAFSEIAIRVKRETDKIDLMYAAEPIRDEAAVDLAREELEYQDKKKGCC